MSKAPQTLVDLRQYLADAFEVPRNRFGIRGRVTARRPWGYHLGRSDIYGPGGMRGRDYSIRRPRDKRGLTDSSAGFDINIGAADERALVAYLVDEARAGRDNRMLVEVIGPDRQGVAKRWAKPDWEARPARADHDWHIHISFHRDTEHEDKRPLFAGFFDPAPPVEDSLENGAELEAADHPEVVEAELEEGLELEDPEVAEHEHEYACAVCGAIPSS